MRTRIDGLLIVDKPEGKTSLDVVREIKHRFQVRKAGHIGTLDPFATGVLPIAIHEGTKLVPFLEQEPKEYEAVLKLGEETTTDDLSGEVTLRRPWENLRPESMHAVFQNFLGRIQQIPPMFSAVKVDGRRLYRLARRGVEVERKQREVEIFNIQIEEIDLPRIRFRVSCSKGTYIRSLGRDIGRRLGCGGHLLYLRRLRSGPFDLKQAIPWERLRELSKAEDLEPWLISLREALSGLPEIIGDDRLVKRLRFGQGMAVRDLSFRDLPVFEKGQCFKMTSPEDGLVAILRSEVNASDIEEGGNGGLVAFRPVRLFHQQTTVRS
ncbi:MAG: tRNA pseudouridine(55) synthase TruB [Syntrophaceae bacterium]|nr:tRNA pseudouridine(55) synthase TruB [Syntrophaceae bacterium]